MRRNFWLAAAVLIVAMAAPASAQTLGGSCAGSPYGADQISVVENNIVVCNGSRIWQSLLGAPAGDPNYSIALGANSLYDLTTGTNNTALGYEAGYSDTTGADNTLVGYKAGYGVQGGHNVILGEDPSSAITTGSSNILIGNSLTGLTNTSSNQLDIGNLIYGNLSSGYVGIGTASPTTQLDVASGGNDYFTVNTATNSAGMNLTTSDVNGSAVFNITKGTGIGSGRIDFYYGATSAANIGVDGSNNFNIQGQNSATTTISAGNSGTLALSAAASGLMTMNVNSAERMRINSSGYVGIGTTSPTGILDVVGGTAAASTSGTNITITAQNGGTGSTNGGSILLNTGSASGTGTAGTVQISGAASGPAFMTTSDARIKTGIAPLENGLAGIAALEGVTYTYRAPAEREIGKDLNLPVGKRQMGVIAQNVEQVFPEAVETMGTTGVKTVNYNMLMAPMIEAVKTLNRRIDALMAAVALLYVVLAVVFLMQIRQTRTR